MPDKSTETAPSLARGASGEQDRKGRVTVTLSSVAKTPPPATLGGASGPLPVPPLADSPTSLSTRTGHHPENAPVAPPLSRTQRYKAGEVLLPPKTAVQPRITKLAGALLRNAPAPLSVATAPPVSLAETTPLSVPPASIFTPEAKAAPQPKRTAAFNLKPFRPEPTPDAPKQATPPAPPGWKHMIAGELRNLPAPVEAKDAPSAPTQPPPPVPKADTLHVAPPLVAPANETEKLRLPPPLRKTEPEPTAPVASVAKAPALVDPAPASLLLTPPRADSPAAPVAKAPALSEPTSTRRLAPPLPVGTARKEFTPPERPPAVSATTPPPLPRITSALQTPPAAPLPVPLVSSPPPKSPSDAALLPPAAVDVPPAPPPLPEEKTTLRSKLKPLASDTSFLEQAELLIVNPVTPTPAPPATPKATPPPVLALKSEPASVSPPPAASTPSPILEAKPSATPPPVVAEKPGPALPPTVAIQPSASLPPPISASKPPLNLERATPPPTAPPLPAVTKASPAAPPLPVVAKASTPVAPPPCAVAPTTPLPTVPPPETKPPAFSVAPKPPAAPPPVVAKSTPAVAASPIPPSPPTKAPPTPAPQSTPAQLTPLALIAAAAASKKTPAATVTPVAKAPAAPVAPAPKTSAPAAAAPSTKTPAPITAAKSAEPASPALPVAPVVATPARSARLRKKQLVGTIAFYVVFIAVILPLLFFLGVHFSSETSVRGQVIPPQGMLLGDEVWVVSDFREQAAGVADDLAAERAPKIQEIQERTEHVQRAQADIAAREERIRLLQDQIAEAKGEIGTAIKQARDAAQKIWDGPGASLENEYKDHLVQLQQSIAARAKTLNLKYVPDDTYQSPEVWANAYRLALYQTPAGVDGAKEHTWIEAQLVAWRAFTKTYDDRKDKLRQQAAQIQLTPTARVNDLNGQIDDLQHRIDSTLAEEEPLKTELQQARTDLAQSQAAEAHLDDAYYTQLYKLPEQSITKRLPLQPNGRFDWTHLEKDSAFSSSEKSHTYWIFSRAVRKDGRQFWMLDHFSISQDSNVAVVIEPGSFISTKAILRPDLSADDQRD